MIPILTRKKFSKYNPLDACGLRRYLGNVGQVHKNKIQVHKKYVREVVPIQFYRRALQELRSKAPDFTFNYIIYDTKDWSIRFIESSDFDTAEQPTLGDTYLVTKFMDVRYAKIKMILHHKWMLVKDNYVGFDVQKAKSLSGYLKANIPEDLKGTMAAFEAQKRFFNI